MLVVLLICIYATFLCWTWGIVILHNIKKKIGEFEYSIPHFSIVCLIGLAGITIFGSCLSLLMPLGQWKVQMLLLIPCLLFIIQKPTPFVLIEIKNQLIRTHRSILFLLLICCMLILIMNSWAINHPDTLYYHAQTIQWIEKYKATPGIVHLHVRYGYQGLWFVSSALFSFYFTGINAVSSANFIVLVWFFFFVSHHLNKKIFEEHEVYRGLLWLLLIIISLWSYTNIRLTATSASSDFIAALFLLVVFYLFLNRGNNHKSTSNQIVIIFLSVFTVTIKLSTFPILIITLFIILRLCFLKRIKLIVFSCLLIAFTLFPFFARNIISSGYLIFPSAFPDIANVDWKYSKELTILEKDYITAYAKGIRVDTKKEFQAAEYNQSLKDWVPRWCSNLSLPDKLLLSLVIFSFIGLIINTKKVLVSDIQTKVAILCIITGIIFWFMQAPDPRFGMGFLIAFPACYLQNWFTIKSFLSKSHLQKIILSAILATALFITGYFTYRAINFFSIRQLLIPMSIEKIPFDTCQDDNIIFRIPTYENPCGNISIPCAYDNCQKFQLRGKSIKDGFKSK